MAGSDRFAVAARQACGLGVACQRIMQMGQLGIDCPARSTRHHATCMRGELGPGLHVNVLLRRAGAR